MEKFVNVGSLKTRYLDAGAGPVVLLLHGASLGSSVEVYEGTIPVLVDAGFRCIAFDAPGYGLTDNPPDYSDSYRSDFILGFIDAVGIGKAHVVAHSASGRNAAVISLRHPQRFGAVIPVAATPLLPPLPDQKERAERAEREPPPPTLESTRKRLEGDLFNHRLITEERVERRYRLSLGKNYAAALEREKPLKVMEQSKEETPLWQRFARSTTRKLYINGKNDRGGTVNKRSALLAELEPQAKIEMIDNCNHLIMIDAAEQFTRALTKFLVVQNKI
jgi:pimeloyl-ACP methyl ester carboxylesterase